MQLVPVRLAVLAARSASLLLLSLAPSAAAIRGEGVAPEYARFAAEVEARIARFDGAFLDRALDVDSMTAIATRGVDLPPQALVDFRRGLGQGLRLGPVVVDAVQDGGSYRLLRLRQEEGATRALFRMLVVDGGVNYHDLTLGRRADGSVCVVDAYYYALGETLSETLRRTLLQLAAERDAGLLQRLLGRERDTVRHLATLKDVQAHIAAGRFERALALYDALPPSVRLEKPFLLARVMITQNLDEPLYVQAMADYEARFRDDPSCDLMLIDLHVLRGDFARALTAVDRLERRVVRDPYLDSLRGQLHLGADQPERAQRAFQRCIDDEPDLDAGYLGLVDLGMATGDFDAVAAQLAKLEQLFGYDFSDIDAEPYFAPFVASPAFRSWRRRTE